MGSRRFFVVCIASVTPASTASSVLETGVQF